MASSSQVDKIHINNSTSLSLNDRFTIMKTTGAPRRVNRSRSRSRSRSRTRPNMRADALSSPAGSIRNRNLLSRFEQKHARTDALRRRNLRNPPGPARNQQMGGQNNRFRRNQVTTLRRAARALNIGGRRLSRANSLSNVATVTDQFNAGRLSRTASMTNLSNRIGQRRRGSSVVRGQLRRTASQRRLGGSQKNLSNIGRRQVGRRGGATGQNRLSVNSRLGRNAGTQAMASPRGRSRVFRRRNSTGGGAFNNRNGGGGAVNHPGQQQRRGRSRNRLPRNANSSNNNNGIGQRGRSRSRNRRQNNNNNNNAGPGRNRSRSQRRNRSRSRQANRQPVKSREQLDKELDQYMSNTSTMDTS